MDDMNSNQRILTFLKERGTRVTKQTICENLRISVHTAAKSLAELNRLGLIRQSKGTYTLLPKGQILFRDDPELSVLAGAKVTRTEIAQEFWSKIYSNPVAEIIYNEYENFLGMDPDLLLPFIYLHKKLTGEYIPKRDFDPKPLTPEQFEPYRVFFSSILELR